MCRSRLTDHGGGRSNPGTLGVAATDAADVFTGASRFWSLGPLVVWPVFAGGRIRANIRVPQRE